MVLKHGKLEYHANTILEYTRLEYHFIIKCFFFFPTVLELGELEYLVKFFFCFVFFFFFWDYGKINIVGDVLQQTPKMREWPKSPLRLFRSVYYGELSPKFQMYNEQKVNSALTRENQNTNNKGAEKA